MLRRFGSWNEFDGYAVDAVAQPCGRGSVVEDVSQVGVAPPALDLDPPHSVTEVLNLGYIVNLITAAAAASFEGVIEAGPAAARLKLVARLKERDFAAEAGVGSLFGVVIDASTGEGTLRPPLSCDVKLWPRQDGPPLFVRHFSRPLLGLFPQLGDLCRRRHVCLENRAGQGPVVQGLSHPRSTC